MRHRRSFAFLATVLGAAAFVAGCGGSGAERLLTSRDLAQAAATSSEAGSGRFTFGMDMTVPGSGDVVSLSGYGAFDSAADRAHVSMDMSSFASLLSGLAPSGGPGPDLTDPELWKIEAVLDGTVMYMRFPLLARIPDSPLRGKSWVKIDLRQAARTAGVDLDQLMQMSSNDPRDMLEMLRAVSGDLELVAEEELRGIETTHYRTAIDLRRYAQLAPASQRAEARSLLDQLVSQSGLRTIPVEVWVDDESLVHRMLVTAAVEQGGQTTDVTMRWDLYDYGQPVAIEVPARAATVDLLKLARG